jgi:hypothetical protein
MRAGIERFYPLLASPIELWSRWLLGLAVVPLLLFFTQPLWNIRMTAPRIGSRHAGNCPTARRTPEGEPPPLQRAPGITLAPVRSGRDRRRLRSRLLRRRRADLAGATTETGSLRRRLPARGHRGPQRWLGQ